MTSNTIGEPRKPRLTLTLSFVYCLWNLILFVFPGTELFRSIVWWVFSIFFSVFYFSNMLLLTYISLEMWFENQGTDKARCNVKSRFKEKKNL